MKRCASTIKRTKIAQVSKKRKVEGAEYSKLRKEFLLAHPRCYCFGLRLGCTWAATEVHHAAKRGKFLNDPEHFRAICRHCHTWAEGNRRDAEALGVTLTQEQIRKLNEQKL